MTRTKMTYTFDSRLHDGHRLFGAGTSGMVYAIADDSGRTPADTDDGPLFLDFSQPLAVEGGSFFLPVHNVRGTRSRTFSTLQTLLGLAERFEWKLTVDDTEYTILKAGE